MNKTYRKVALIGAGLVGVSVLYSCINKGLAEEYGIIDINDAIAEGHALDFEDASAANNHFYKIKKIDYSELKDYDVVIITAGRPQKPGETRLEMVADNSKIMNVIAKNIKNSGFKGISIVVANPVDVMTYVYWKSTGFDKNRVISSGTSLDSARLRFEISKKLNVHPKSVQAFVLGEHGDSSVSAYSAATISGKLFLSYVEEGLISKEELKIIHNTVYRKAYEIINRKGSTYFGIGATVSEIVEAILNDSHSILACGPYLEGQYGLEGLFIGVPTVISANGVEKIIELKINDKETKQLHDSASVLKENIKKALEVL